MVQNSDLFVGCLFAETFDTLRFGSVSESHSSSQYVGIINANYKKSRNLIV